MRHECDFKFFCEELVQLLKDKESGIVKEDEFEESLWELAEEMKLFIVADAEMENE